MELSLLIEGRKHLSDQVYHGIRRAILDGRLGVEERLPASRELAQQLNVSRNTVLAAYGRLLSEGYLNSNVGSGTYVAQHAPTGERRLRERSQRIPAAERLRPPPDAAASHRSEFAICRSTSARACPNCECFRWRLGGALLRGSQNGCQPRRPTMAMPQGQGCYGQRSPAISVVPAPYTARQTT